VNKTAASDAQSAKCILLHAYSRTATNFQLRETIKNFIQLPLQVGITVFLVIN